MKNKLIIIFILLSTGINLYGGCWMPESDKVKNHYTKNDGGYIRIVADDPKRSFTSFMRVKGEKRWPFLSDDLLFAAVTFGLALPAVMAASHERRFFGPTGWKPDWKKNNLEASLYGVMRYATPPQIVLPAGPFLPLIKKYWPNLVNIKVYATYVKDFPCYINTTEWAFERWKKNYLLKKERKKKEKEREKKEKEKIHLSK